MLSCEISKIFKNTSGGCLWIPLRRLCQNCKYISNQCIKVSVWSVAWWCIHSKIMPALDNVGSKNMLAHVLLSLLVFEHGFIQISFRNFEFFTRYPFYWILHDIFSLRYFHDIFYNFSLMRNITRRMLDTEVTVYRLWSKSISYFMKWPWNCISWNDLKEKFHCVSFP